VASPILFFKKKEESLRPCIDYRKLNQDNIKDKYPLPLIIKILLSLPKAKFITKIDISDVYSFIWIQDEDIWNTAI
jgi:hypothetical protein